MNGVERLFDSNGVYNDVLKKLNDLMTK